MAEPKLLIVAATFYREIADALIDGATKRLEEAGVRFDMVEVPGAFEIPAAIGFALDRYQGFVALGCVIRGETSHYDHVCGESARGLQDLAIQRGAAIGYGILTVENRDQAWARARSDDGGKGYAAADACLAMIALKQRFSDE